MKKVIVFSLAIIMLFAIVSCGGSDNDDDFSPPDCSDMAGGYYGNFTDNCPGYNVSGEILVSVRSDCTFSGQSNMGVTNTGIFNIRTGNNFQWTGTTDALGCGSFDIGCTKTGNQLDCTYTYANGRTGVIQAWLQ